MKKFTTLLSMLAIVITLPLSAQEKPKSPKAVVNGKLGNSNVEIVYCQPSARGRKVMGELVPFGEVWRTGANEATTIKFDQPVKVEGKELAAGTYSLFTIPNKDEWTIIFNNNTKQWGHYSYKQSEDVLRVSVKPTQTNDFTETFVINTDKEKLTLKWENTAVAVNIK